jgi:dihydroxyacetone kinase-like protein
MKKIMNDPKFYIEDMINGVVAQCPEKLERIKGFDVIKRKLTKKNKVALISGGGSGHEPAHAGFVGEGMLDAAVIGPVFTSPTPMQIEAALEATANKEGVLLIVKNYTGDRLNFEAAKMIFEVKGIPLETIIVGDDVAIEDTSNTAGARGLAGTVFVHKIAGALAETGASLKEVAHVANEVANNIRTMGVGLTPCIVPVAGTPSFNLNDNEVELGLGIHGEPGIKKDKMRTSKEFVKELLKPILKNKFFDNSRVAVIINGLGGTPISELYIANNDLQTELKQRNIIVVKTLVGDYMTSLEMKGFSITLLKLTTTTEKLLLAKSDTLS